MGTLRVLYNGTWTDVLPGTPGPTGALGPTGATGPGASGALTVLPGLAYQWLWDTAIDVTVNPASTYMRINTPSVTSNTEIRFSPNAFNDTLSTNYFINIAVGALIMLRWGPGASAHYRVTSVANMTGTSNLRIGVTLLAYTGGTPTAGTVITVEVFAPPTATMASGGTTGQVLTKTSTTDYATTWATPAAASAGSTIRVYQATNDSRVNDNTFSNASGLTVSALAVGTYAFELDFGVNSNGGTGGGKWRLFMVTGAFSAGGATGLFINGTTAGITSQGNSVTNLPISSSSSGTARSFWHVRGFVTVSTAGDFAVQWGQATASSTASTLEPGSTVTLDKIG